MTEYEAIKRRDMQDRMVIAAIKITAAIVVAVIVFHSAK